MSRWSVRRRSSEPRAQQGPQADRPAVLRLPDEGRQQVVGEHFYRAAFERICRGKPVPAVGDPGCWEDSLPVTARLVAEQDNRYDRTAIRVEVEGMTVGHLPREDAALLHRFLTDAQETGQQAECEGRIVIASNGDYSIYLLLATPDSVTSALRYASSAAADDPRHSDASGEEAPQAGAPGMSFGRFSDAELEDARMAYQANYNYRTMNCGRGSAEITTIVGTSRFQDALRSAAATPRPWRHQLDRHLPAVVVRNPGRPTNVAVLIDGSIVGFLDSEVAERHREQLEELERAGQHLVCSALIVGGGQGRYFGVRLQIKPGIGRRWAAGAKPSS